MSIGKKSINRVAAGLDNENAAPLSIPTAVEEAIVEGTAEAAAEATLDTPTAVEEAIVKGTAKKKPAAKKKTTAKKPAATEKKEEAKSEAAETVAPELVGQSAAAPAARRGRKPGSKNKKKATPRATRIPRAPETAKAFLAVAIGEDLPVYLL